VSYQHITTPKQLAEFVGRLAGAETIAFDTEFVSEHTYRSDLCLIQVAAGGELAVIDPLAAGETKTFWEAIADGRHETIVHAGREELVFCLAATGRRPSRLFDIQIAAGLVGYEYPAGYGALLGKLLGERPQKGETRTDWRRRPLSRQQIEYALDDVRYLPAMRDRLHDRLAALGRIEWMQTEMTAWQDEVEAARTAERWRRVSGTNGLSSRSLAVVREMWRWREAEAERRDSPVRRVLRDDLIVELAKRRSADPKQIRAIRGLERGDLQRFIPKIAEHIAQALELPDAECPRGERRETPNQLNLLGQFLSSALTSICRSAEIAPSIVGSASDVRDLIAYRLGFGGDEPPLLARGWREEIVGQLIEDLLAGHKSIRIADPNSDHPLVFESASAEERNDIRAEHEP
jgi:ribonuclease D